MSVCMQHHALHASQALSLILCPAFSGRIFPGALDAFFNSLMANSVAGTTVAMQLQHMREVTAQNALLQVGGKAWPRECSL